MSSGSISSKNPHGICTWQEASNCTGCPLEERLNCRFNWNDLLYFLVLFLTPAIAAVVGMLLGGFGGYLLGWAGYAIFFFFIWEARILCSHCPYWAEEGRVLHCLANHGVLKIWRFHPEPMSTSEKIQFLVGAGLLVLYPFPFLIIAGQYIFVLITLSGFAGFAFSLKKHVCTRCVNFSCPLNGVPKITVDAYLRGNPVMHRAWEAKGYRLGTKQGRGEIMNQTKILVYGAGPLGSLFAARLHEGGNDVSLLARGKRLSDLREHGIVLRDFYTKQETVTHVKVIESLKPQDAYDLVLVIMRKNHALEILSVLAANQHTPNVLFLMNNAAGPETLVDALGKGRVLVGFPNSAGYFEGHRIHCIAGQVEDKAGVLLGEVDGSITERTKWVASVFETMPGYEGDIQTDMDAWHKTHVALLFPSLGPALYAAGTDNFRFARTRDLLVLAIRAIKEGFQVLRELNIPIVPTRMRIFDWIPEPLAVLFLKRLITHPAMKIALVGHANAARSEVHHLADEFLVLARSTSVPTPAIDQLYPYLDPETPLMSEGSKEIPLRWGGLLVWSVGLASFIPLLISLLKRKGDEAEE